MKEKLALLAVIFLVVALVSGCVSEEAPPEPSGGKCLEPKKMIGEICCYDENDNDICDIDEVGCPDTCDDNNTCTNDTCSPDTDFECVHEYIYPCCGNDVCDQSEDAANICPEDCEVLEVDDFALVSEKAFIEDGVYQFIHTMAASPLKHFRLNITAEDQDMQEIRYTFTCNSTQHEELDSINSEAYNETDDLEEKVNKLETENYIVYTNFFVRDDAQYYRNIEELEEDERAWFNFKIQKKEPQKRDDLTCLIKLYFIQPKKVIHKWLDISYI